MLQNAALFFFFFFCDDILKKPSASGGIAPGPHWGPTAAPRPPHHFPPFSLFPSPMSVVSSGGCVVLSVEEGGGGYSFFLFRLGLLHLYNSWSARCCFGRGVALLNILSCADLFFSLFGKLFAAMQFICSGIVSNVLLIPDLLLTRHQKKKKNSCLGLYLQDQAICFSLCRCDPSHPQVSYWQEGISEGGIAMSCIFSQPFSTSRHRWTCCFRSWCITS